MDLHIIPAKACGRQAVLVVEDEEVSRRALMILLTSNGFNVTAAESGEEALRRLPKAGMPIVALVDLDLPGMDGLELIDRLRRRGREMYSILITASGEDDVAPRAEEKHVTYMRKPIDFPRLMTLISENIPVH